MLDLIERSVRSARSARSPVLYLGNKLVYLMYTIWKRDEPIARGRSVWAGPSPATRLKPRRSALSQSARPASKWCTLGKQVCCLNTTQGNARTGLSEHYAR